MTRTIFLIRRCAALTMTCTVITWSLTFPRNDDYNGKFRQDQREAEPFQSRSADTQGLSMRVESVGQLPGARITEAPAIAAARHASTSSPSFSFNGSALSFPVPNRPGLSSHTWLRLRFLRFHLHPAVTIRLTVRTFQSLHWSGDQA